MDWSAVLNMGGIFDPPMSTCAPSISYVSTNPNTVAVSETFWTHLPICGFPGTGKEGLYLLPWVEVGVLASAHPHQSGSKVLCDP